MTLNASIQTTSRKGELPNKRIQPTARRAQLGEVPIMLSVGGPVKEEGGLLVLRIPLEAGGAELAECATGIGKIEDWHLVVVIPQWLADQLQIAAGSEVIVDNEEGKLRITRHDPDEQPG